MKEISREWLRKAQDDIDVIGLLPNGKPTEEDANKFFEFAILIYGSVKKKLEETT